MCVGLQVTGSQGESDRGEAAARLQVLLWLPVSYLHGRFHVVHLAEDMAFFFHAHVLCTHASFRSPQFLAGSLFVTLASSKSKTELGEMYFLFSEGKEYGE